MSPAAILVFSLVSFLSAPAAFILLWILHRQTRDRAVRELAFAILGNTFVLLGNLLTVLVEGFTLAPDAVYVLLLDEVTVATIMSGAFACRFAHSATQVPVTPALHFTFWSWAFVLHTVVLSAAILPGAGTEGANVTNGFTVATLGALIMQIYVTVLIVSGRRRTPVGFFIPHLYRYFVPLLLLGIIAAANDIFQFGTRLGGEAIPFSPFFSILINGFIIVIISRKLVSGSPTARVVGTTTANFGLTQRESEILPLLLDGSSNEDIAQKLAISPHTVKNHISVIFRKTGAKNRFDLLKTLHRTVTD